MFFIGLLGKSHPPGTAKNGHAWQVALIQIKGTREVRTGYAGRFHKYDTAKKTPASVGREGIMSVALSGVAISKPSS
jgi:hypothetical protein